MFETLLARGEHLAEVQAQRAVLRFPNGVDWLIRDPTHLVDCTPFDIVFQRDKLSRRRIAPPEAVRAQLDALGSSDATFRLVPGGHMGVFAGNGAPRQVWQPATEWLAARALAAPSRRAIPAMRGPRRTRHAGTH